MTVQRSLSSLTPVKKFSQKPQTFTLILINYACSRLPEFLQRVFIFYFFSCHRLSVIMKFSFPKRHGEKFFTAALRVRWTLDVNSRSRCFILENAFLFKALNLKMFLKNLFRQFFSSFLGLFTKKVGENFGEKKMTVGVCWSMKGVEMLKVLNDKRCQ
jgi:hypothetical protein